jgi:transcriptional regulator with XRE-family HTH domain
MTDDYLAGIQVLYDGEVMGERLVLALHAAARTPREAAHFAAILQLETETKARLRPLLLKHGMSLAESADLTGIPGRLADYAGRTWRGYTAATAARLTRVLGVYEAIAGLGPPEDQPILQAVVAHEAALLAWAQAEADGKPDQSLAAITGLLCFPPAASG